MVDFVHLNVLALYFVYGLSFYTMGIAIAVQYRTYSSFRLANSINLLAVFALLLGVGEWGSLFMPVRIPDFGQFPLWKLLVIQRLIVSVAYFFLFSFGVKLINNSFRRPFPFWYLIPTLAFFIWLIMFSRFVFMTENNEVYQWLLHSDCWSRYLLAFPGGFLTAVGLFMQIPEVKKIGSKSEPVNLWVAIIAFFLFSFFNGLIIPYDMGFLGRVFNYSSFRQLLGFPVEFFRALIAILATWSITSMLSIFETEKQRQLLNSRRAEAIFRERERFARDLHDDVIQSIYGSGLDLQAVPPLIKSNHDLAVNRISSVVKRLNQVIKHLRAYIQDLESEACHLDLETVVERVIEECVGDLEIKISYTVQLNEDLRDRLCRMDRERKQLVLILREALSNVIKHANADQAELEIRSVDDTLLVSVRDNGQGLSGIDTNDVENGLGIRNIRARAMMLGGTAEWSSKEGEGTVLELSVPLP